MTTDDVDADLPAGDFSSWLDGMQRALAGEQPSDVPCGSCTACCTSSQFVHIAPDETATLGRIPSALLFAAPGLPDGHVLMGYDERGHCPMLVEGACTIYDDRPRTCRTYDCRVFPAAGVDVGVDAKPLIARQARRWQFSFPTETDGVRQAAVEAAAAFLRDNRAQLGAGVVANNATQLAVLAVEIHSVFLDGDEPPTMETVAAEMRRLRSR